MEKTLNINEPQKVSYCIPTWLRDEQIKLSIARVKGRILPYYEERKEPIAIVGYGPSLRDTWEKIRDFKYVISCSGSHKFLIERGIIPTWHVEVDPRSHKVELIGPPHKDVEYLIASACHPKVFEHLEGFNVKLWHILDNGEEAVRILPRGEWAITGGCDVGLRAITIARFFQFTEMHIFGIDGSAPDADGGRHAGDHPNKIKSVCLLEYEGRTFNTTPPMAEAARGIWHELDMIPDAKVTFYGDGLIQHMSKFYQRKKTDKLYEIAVLPREVISSQMRNLNNKLHRDVPEYGVGGGKHKDVVLRIATKMKTTSVLDYGCGKGFLAGSMPFPIWEYDPAIPGKDMLPRPADLVVCTDVLEHVEPEKLAAVLEDLKRCVKEVGYFVIHTGPAVKQYADGRNTHLIQQNAKWWNKKLRGYFDIGKIFVDSPQQTRFVVGKKSKKKPEELAKVSTAASPKEELAKA